MPLDSPSFKDRSILRSFDVAFLVAVLGEAGKHARAAVGVASLPFGVAVEIDAVFEIRL